MKIILCFFLFVILFTFSRIVIGQISNNHYNVQTDLVIAHKIGNKYDYSGSWYHNGGYSRSGTYRDVIIGDTLINNKLYSILQRSKSLLSIFGPHNLSDAHGNMIFCDHLVHFQRLENNLLYEYNEQTNKDRLLIDFETTVGTNSPEFGYVSSVKNNYMFLGKSCKYIAANDGNSIYYIKQYVSFFGPIGFTISGGGIAGEFQLIGAVMDSIAFGDTTKVGTNIKSDHYSLNTDFKLNNNYPNPFNASTIISFDIFKPGFYSLSIMDILGNEIILNKPTHFQVGTYQFVVNSFSLSSGVYFYKFGNTQTHITKKMILLK